jgi:hypothetical protein
MGDGLREFEITDDKQGVIKLLVAIPRGNDPWGVLAPLKNTAWGAEIQVIDAEPYSHALHGWVMPLVRVLGVAPKVRARRVVEVCGLQRGCIGFKKGICQPGIDLPDCYEAPDLKPEAALIATRVALAWREGRYVVVVEGEGFSLS